MDHKTKALSGLKITNEDQGEVEAVFATLNVKDSDGDVTLPGAFEDSAPVRISAYNHKSWQGALPVGKGTISEDGDQAVFKGRFFMNTDGGKETFTVVKELGDLGEWSYGYDVVDSEKGTKDGESVRFLKRQMVHEVSPVILGAGLGTKTLAMKGAKQLNSDLRSGLAEAGEEKWGGKETSAYLEDFDPDESYAVYSVFDGSDSDLIRVDFTRSEDGDVTLAEDSVEVERETSYSPKGRTNLQLKGHIKSVLTALDELTTRAAEVKTLRLKDGKDLGSDSKELLSGIETSLNSLKEVLTPVADPNKPLISTAESQALLALDREIAHGKGTS